MKAMFVLAHEFGKGPVQISDIARRENIPHKFLELILLDMRNKGLVHSKKGKGGGYLLARDPRQVTLGQILRAVEGPLAPIPCVSRTAYMACTECVDERTCGVRLVMKDVRDATANILDSMTLAGVLQRVETAANEKPALTYAI